MRRTFLTLLLVSLAAPWSFAQNPPEVKPDRPPGKGDDVQVRGCVSGSAFESYETRRADETGRLATAITYRLTGPRSLLRQLRTEHAGHQELLTGVLKSVLPEERLTRGREIGKSRIFIGVAQPSRDRGPAAEMPHIPVLEVTSFEHLSNRCGS